MIIVITKEEELSSEQGGKRPHWTVRKGLCEKVVVQTEEEFLFHFFYRLDGATAS